MIAQTPLDPRAASGEAAPQGQAAASFSDEAAPQAETSFSEHGAPLLDESFWEDFANYERPTEAEESGEDAEVMVLSDICGP